MPSINLTLGDLEAVLAVAEAASFRMAAQRLNLSQPAVSARIQHAEQVLGVKLFSRTTRKVALTERGEELRMRAERTLGDLQALARDFKDEALLKRGRVVVGATPTISGALMPEVIMRFRQRWPGVEVLLRDDFFGGSLERVITGEVDFAVVPFRKTDLRLQFDKLCADEIMLVLPAGHALLKAKTASLHAIARYPIFAMPPHSALWGRIADAFAAARLEFTPVFQTQHMVSLLAMVKCGFGVTFLPRLILPMLNLDGVETQRIGRGGLHREICIASDRSRAMQPAAVALVAAFRERLGVHAGG